jgi:hypothetical protein
MPFLAATAVTTLLVLQAPDSVPREIGASITGIVSDAETGAPVTGALVTVSGTTLSSASAGDGSYLLPEVPQGTRALVVARLRYHPRSFRAIVPAVGSVRIDVALHPAPTTLPAIQVNAPAAQPSPASDSLTGWSLRRVGSAGLLNDPRLAEADALEAVGGGAVAVDPEAPEGLHILGGASDQVAYTIDGMPVLSPYHASGTFGAWNPDAVAQLDMRAAPASPADFDGMSGAVAATTITPGRRHEVRGSISSTQLRFTFSGPLGLPNAGYLIGLRSTFPGLIAHRREPSYVGGEGSDWIAKVESPFAGGRARLLGYGSDNETNAAALASPGNEFLWRAQSFGADWSGHASGAELNVGLWSASSDAGATWRPDTSEERLSAQRRDVGVRTAVGIGPAGEHTTFELHVRRSATRYRVATGIADSAGSTLKQTTRLWSGSIAHERTVTSRSAVILLMGSGLVNGVLRLDPAAEVRWRPTTDLVVSAGLSRRHQFAQSLRNEESVVGAIFPADLYLGAGRGGVPVARSDLGVVTLEYRAGAGTRLTGMAYMRNLGDLVLVAPVSGGPFAGTGPSSFLRGSGSSAGITVEAAASGMSYGVNLRYGLQRSRLAFGDASYAPSFGIGHSIDAGALLMSSPGTSIKIGVTALLGRHGTAVTGPFEWESCNLLDNGCEFAGSPRAATQEIGLLDLPPYLRLDLGLRHRWILHLGSRDAELAIFGTVTNILNRQNVMTRVIDPVTGARGNVDMRPRSPLSVGLDWRY